MEHINARDFLYLMIRNGIFYYRRRIPIDLFNLYNKERITISLKTKSRRNAILKASKLTMELDAYWSSIRITEISQSYIGKHSQNTNLSGISIIDALKYYLKHKGYKKSKAFYQSSTRSVDYFIGFIGEKDISTYSSQDVAKFRDFLFEKGLVSSSIKRIFSSIKSILNFSIKEKGLSITNPFLGIYIPDKGDTLKRQPISMKNIKKIQNKCIEINDDLRLIIALISDTGMRLSEAVGIRRQEIFLDCDIPHLLIKENSKRTLKTKQSERLVPLVGKSLWAIKQILESSNSEYVFERYNKTKTTNTNSASAVLNKWIKSVAGEQIVVHSFRHSMRDRLRSVECPKDIIDQIGGWSKGTVGENYGNGYPLRVLHKWMLKIE